MGRARNYFAAIAASLYFLANSCNMGVPDNAEKNPSAAAKPLSPPAPKSSVLFQKKFDLAPLRTRNFSSDEIYGIYLDRSAYLATFMKVNNNSLQISVIDTGGIGWGSANAVCPHDFFVQQNTAIRYPYEYPTERQKVRGMITQKPDIPEAPNPHNLLGRAKIPILEVEGIPFRIHGNRGGIGANVSGGCTRASNRFIEHTVDSLPTLLPVKNVETTWLKVGDKRVRGQITYTFKTNFFIRSVYQPISKISLKYGKDGKPIALKIERDRDFLRRSKAISDTLLPSVFARNKDAFSRTNISALISSAKDSLAKRPLVRTTFEIPIRSKR